jgi:peptidoglycan/xylan/chitin deacetylase (PgdA/CDA1 family)
VFPVAGYIGKASSWDVLPQFPHLSKHEIREISGLGHEIGSHGLTHSNLTYLNASDLKTELSDSKKILEDITGKKVTSLSFPFGSWNRRVWEHAQETGYLRGTIYRQHRNYGPELVPVYGVYRFDSPEFILARISPASRFSFSIACARIMSHFAKGAPIWKFEKNYCLFPK